MPGASLSCWQRLSPTANGHCTSSFACPNPKRARARGTGKHTRTRTRSRTRTRTRTRTRKCPHPPTHTNTHTHTNAPTPRTWPKSESHGNLVLEHVLPPFYLGTPRPFSIYLGLMTNVFFPMPKVLRPGLKIRPTILVIYVHFRWRWGT